MTYVGIGQKGGGTFAMESPKEGIVVTVFEAGYYKVVHPTIKPPSGNDFWACGLNELSWGPRITRRADGV